MIAFAFIVCGIDDAAHGHPLPAILCVLVGGGMVWTSKLLWRASDVRES